MVDRSWLIYVEVMREVKWVIFDEVHYMRDKERGVVWEEVMILLPRSVRYTVLYAMLRHATFHGATACLTPPIYTP